MTGWLIIYGALIVVVVLNLFAELAEERRHG